MPKDRRVSSSSIDRAMMSPYSCSLKISDGNNGDSSSHHVGNVREWEEARCPICMEHPHNAVLLLCSSSEKGCRPFVCDTSYRHSNCLDQFCRSSSLRTPIEKQKCELVCPLCRGLVTGWDVVHPARKLMNFKIRSCSLETCSFNGNYAELRKHARLEHPSGRPSEASPNRQLNWATLERQREIEDALAYQSDFEYDFDGWPSFDDWTSFDEWEDDASFFDSSSGMSGIESEMESMFSGLSLSFSLCPTSPEDAKIDSGSSRSRERTPRPVLPTNSNLRSNNHGRYISSTSRSISGEEGARSRLGYRRDLDEMNTRPISSFHRENSSANPSSRSGYHREYAPISSRTRTSYPRENDSTNVRSISGSRSGDHRVTAPTRSSHPRENGSTASRSRSSYHRENISSRSSYHREDAWPRRSRSSYHRENMSSRSSYHREDAWPRRSRSYAGGANSSVRNRHLRGSSRLPRSSYGHHRG